MRILAVDTATEALSVALLVDGNLLGRYEVIGRGHAERALPLVDELLAEAGVGLRSLDAIAFGRGPGAFTGVRIAVSIAQGLAFGADRPVIPVSDLAALARRALDAAVHSAPTATAALVCLDARMGEVYAGLALERGAGGLELVREWLAGPDAVGLEPLAPGLLAVGAGHGFAAHPGIAARLSDRLVAVWPELLPRAAEIARLAALEFAAGRVLSAAEARPVYLRDEVATRSGRRADA